MRLENGVVIWDGNSAADFKTEFPEFTAVDEAVLARRFEFAIRIVDNSPRSIVPPGERMFLYKLVVAHQSFVEGRGAGLTGQVASAAQGSVSMTMASLAQGKFADPWLTSDYGKQYWLATEKYRTMFYVPAPPTEETTCRKPLPEEST
jgi:hypothetical protein